MKTRGLLTLPVMLVAVLALALGSIGTATASGLTKGAVKKIAAKVVAHKASTLSVAHATTANTATTAGTANNANNLGGKSPATYLNQTTTVSLSPVAGVTNFTQTLPTIPNGTYLVTMNISASFSAPGPLSCLLETNAFADLMQDYSGTFNAFAKMNAAQIVTVSTPLKVFCTTNGATMSSPDGTPADTLSFTRLDSVTNAGTASRDSAAPAVRPDGSTAH